MKKCFFPLLFPLFLITISNAMESGSEVNLKVKIGARYSANVVKILTDFWKNNLVTERSQNHAEQLFTVIQQIKAIKESDDNTFSVLEKWKKAVIASDYLNHDPASSFSKRVSKKNKSLIHELLSIHSEIEDREKFLVNKD